MVNAHGSRVAIAGQFFKPMPGGTAVPSVQYMGKMPFPLYKNRNDIRGIVFN